MQLRHLLRGSDRVERVLQQIHHHLLQLPATARDLARRAFVPMHFKCGGHTLANPVDGALGHLGQIDAGARIGVHRRKALEAVDDVGRALRAFHRALDQRRQIGQHVIDAQLLAHGLQLRGRLVRVHGFEISAQPLHITIERMHIAQHKADRVV